MHFGITELVAVFIVMLIFNMEYVNIKMKPEITLLGLIFQSIIIYILTKVIIELLNKKTNIKDLFRNITFKQICILTISLSVYILPQIIILSVTDYSYPTSFLVINSIQFIGITLFLFIYLKRDIELEKTQNDLLTSELHNKTMVGMVDGVRTLKHDYNNIMQALNRICINKTI